MIASNRKGSARTAKHHGASRQQRYATSNEDCSTFQAAVSAIAFVTIGYGSFVLLALAGVW